MRRGPLVALALTALLLAGCSEREEPLGPDVSAYPVTITGARAEPTEVETKPQRIVALAPGAAEIVGALGAGERLVGIPARTSVPGASTAQLVTRPSGLVDAAEVVRLEPDLLVAPRGTSDDLLEDLALRSEPAVYVQPDTSVRDVVRSIRDLGFLVGEPALARRLAAAVRRESAAVEEAVAGREPVRVFIDLGLLLSPPADSLVADLVRRAGGVPVGTDEPGVPRAACDIVRLRPAVVLRVRDPIAPTRDPRFDACPGRAAREVRVVGVTATLVGRPGPRVGEALEEVARRLHPDAFD